MFKNFVLCTHIQNQSGKIIISKKHCTFPSKIFQLFSLQLWIIVVYIHRFVEFGPHGSETAMLITDFLSETLELPNLAEMSIYNMVLGFDMQNLQYQKRLLTRQLTQHKKLKAMFAFSCKQDLIAALQSTCNALRIRFVRNQKSNIISIFTFLS